MKFKNRDSERTSFLNTPLDAKTVCASSPNIKEPRLIDDWVLWLEQRPNEGGRTTALVRPWGKTDCSPQELTHFKWNIKSSIHGYGGAALAAVCSCDQIFLTWVDHSDGCLWSQSWQGLQTSLEKKEPLLIQLTEPICLSKKADFYLGDGLIDLKKMRWLGVMEKDDRDYLVSFSLNDALQEPKVIYIAKDFLGYLKLSPNSNKLAWVEWQKPSMPWDQSELCLASVSDEGELSSHKIFVNPLINSSKKVSVFQPTWLNNDQLVFAEDSNDWWNLKRIDFKNDLISNYKHICNIQAEFAMPQWIAGMSTIAISQDRILALSCKNTTWKLNLINHNQKTINIDLPFDNLSYLDANQGRVILIAGNSFKESSLLEVDLVEKPYTYKLEEKNSILNQDEISVAEDFWFKGFHGRITHALYYAPNPRRFNVIPLLVKIHSGPTSMASRGLNLSTQFWTSRGWAVVDVNYGGSTGFGRDYRDRLREGWGTVDVVDCYSAVKELLKLGKAHNNYIAIEGSSAGGFTALASLCYSKIFNAAACKYPVTDLIDMSETTHRFESNYLDYLVGPLSKNKEKYYDKSPINHIKKITSPVIFFHGMKDKVVKLEQVNKIFFGLKKNQIPVELYTFRDQGHGFRDALVNIEVLELTERFFNVHLGL
ncbi:MULTISPECIES: alpha/beta hydrolase family protein [Prochlorococcus]|uniref:Dipeptidyl aminopeptidase family enzyme n=1 Tax=Prochlorococcus marinus (strain SARG / CCMP1375 / SS120) TaxID=167539 RepID=Q7VED1_PROMA|nr:MULTISPECIES: prolyl oligopeptidase family serine peptidase [Prochlorococcus]AAP99128.1 Dipeptidyl aminopeptidase family enzyme [Prochlorococcus marinus subsp. marinus str. CCMP1375]KGG11603.1 Esterase/lipase/thioesterase family active site [Prochlorococcus marinus str. LG]KGG22380.1 Esterase/lipase/thioesterase family active site [Prochlorococcus marinus str. SS2]KGG22716.1 Esterase/lipase/thioesterase family active site [Prochlorococcus marinus str. SS35]KGG32863.1 Esterase/lipase/thioest